MPSSNEPKVVDHQFTASVQKHMPTVYSFVQDHEDIEMAVGKKNKTYSCKGAHLEIPESHSFRDLETLMACVDLYHKNILESRKKEMKRASKVEKKAELDNPVAPIQLQISVFGTDFPTREFVLYYKIAKDKDTRLLYAPGMTDKQAFMAYDRAVTKHGEKAIMQPIAETLKAVKERREQEEWAAGLGVLKRRVAVDGAPEDAGALEFALAYIIVKYKLGVKFDEQAKAERFVNNLRKAVLKTNPEIRMKQSATQGPGKEDSTLTNTLFSGATDAFVYLDQKQLATALGQKNVKRSKIPSKSIRVFEELELSAVFKSLQQYPKMVSKQISFLTIQNKVVQKNGRNMFKKPVEVKTKIGGEPCEFLIMESLFGIGQISVALRLPIDPPEDDPVNTYRFGAYKEICDELDKGKPWQRQTRAQRILDVLRQAPGAHANWQDPVHHMTDKQRAAAKELIILTQVAEAVPAEGQLAEWINYKLKMKFTRQEEKARGGSTTAAQAPRVDKLSRAAFKAIAQGDAKFADMFYVKTTAFEPVSMRAYIDVQNGHGDLPVAPEAEAPVEPQPEPEPEAPVEPEPEVPAEPEPELPTEPEPEVPDEPEQPLVNGDDLDAPEPGTSGLSNGAE